MYSPQRNNRAQPFDRFSPHNKSPNDYRAQKRTYEGLTLEEFLAAKKSSSSSSSSTRSPIRSSTTTTTNTTTAVSRSLPNRTNTTVQNRLNITRSSPVRPSTVRKPITTTRSPTSPSYKRARPTTSTRQSVFNSTRTTTTTTTTPVRPTVIPNRRPTVYNRQPQQQPHVDKYASHYTTAQPQQKPKAAFSSNEQKIQVCIRKRPLNKAEISSRELDVAPLSGSRTIEILAPK